MKEVLGSLHTRTDGLTRTPVPSTEVSYDLRVHPKLANRVYMQESFPLAKALHLSISSYLTPWEQYNREKLTYSVSRN